MNHSFSRVIASAALAAAAAFGIAVSNESEAQAGVHVHIGGHVHVHIGGGHGTVHWTVHRPPPPPPVDVHVGGAIWVGGGTYYGPRYSAPPPPPSYGCDCGTSDYYPVTAGPAPVVVASSPARPALPRWGVGVAAGGVDVQGNHSGDDLALLGRFRFTPGLSIEGEIGKSSLADNSRVDRRMGASLVYEIGAYNRWAPYAVGGMGVTQVDVGGGDYQSDQSFAELGVGLRFSLSSRIDIAADVRAGSRKTITESKADTGTTVGAAAMVVPPADGNEDYTRFRLSAMLYF